MLHRVNMKLLFPTIKFETKKVTELDQFIIETNFSFPTQIVLQNWKHCAIITVTLFGFGFTYRRSYDDIP